MPILVASWQFWAISAAVFAALTAIFAKLGVASINPDFATFIRTAVVMGVLSVILVFTGQYQRLSTIPRSAWLFLTLSGLCTGASWLSYFRAMKLGNASKVAPIDKLSVVLVAIFGVLFLGEKLSLTDWVGVTLIGAGAVLIAIR